MRGAVSLIAGIWGLGGCASTQPEQMILGREFGLIKTLSPEFEFRANGRFIEMHTGRDGSRYPVTIGGLDFMCAGRSPEYFEFAENKSGSAPEIISRAERSYMKRFKTESFPGEMLRSFADRSKTTEEDAIRKLPKLEPSAWPPFGVVDYLAYDDGWLIAYDLGEFGGALVWLPKEGDSILVSDQNTADLEQAGDIVYAAQGLDHLGLMGGGVRVLEKRLRQWTRVRNGELYLVSGMGWIEHRPFIATASAVEKVAHRDGLLVGLTKFGLIVVAQDGVARYNMPLIGDTRNVVQWAQDIFIDGDGDVYVGGADVIGVYSDLPDRLEPDLYARKDCNFDYGLSDEESR